MRTPSPLQLLLHHSSSSAPNMDRRDNRRNMGSLEQIRLQARLAISILHHSRTLTTSNGEVTRAPVIPPRLMSANPMITRTSRQMSVAIPVVSALLAAMKRRLTFGLMVDGWMVICEIFKNSKRPHT